jgi:hypothetical protein
MLKSLKWIAFLLIIALGGCATAVSPATPSAPQPSVSPLASPLTSPLTPNGPIVVYHRSGGIAGIDETWSIYADGRVEHAGRGTGQSIQLTLDQINAFVQTIRMTDFNSIQDSYVGANTCCDRILYTITINLDDNAKSIKTIDGATGEPAALTLLQSAINDLLK